MTKKIAAGVIIFRRENRGSTIEFLLLKSSKDTNNWTPPKGHLECDETKFQAAIRETQEESGLKNDLDYKLIDTINSISISYPVNGKLKTTFYWCAELNNERNSQVILSREHLEYKWLGIEEALKIVKYEAMQNALEQSHKIILEYLKSTDQ
jgi:8-oxo-dGTP pyrophosphatase MutT (NUDIX family)